MKRALVLFAFLLAACGGDEPGLGECQPAEFFTDPGASGQLSFEEGGGADILPGPIDLAEETGDVRVWHVDAYTPYTVRLEGVFLPPQEFPLGYGLGAVVLSGTCTDESDEQHLAITCDVSGENLTGMLFLGSTKFTVVCHLE